MSVGGVNAAGFIEAFLSATWSTIPEWHYTLTPPIQSIREEGSTDLFAACKKVASRHAIALDKENAVLKVRSRQNK